MSTRPENLQYRVRFPSAPRLKFVVCASVFIVQNRIDDTLQLSAKFDSSTISSPSTKTARANHPGFSNKSLELGSASF